jgi:hypothetical protein
MKRLEKQLKSSVDDVPVRAATEGNAHLVRSGAS